MHASDKTVASATSPTTILTLATVDRYVVSDVVGAALTLGGWQVPAKWTYRRRPGP